jgi:hypothetical protein
MRGASIRVARSAELCAAPCALVAAVLLSVSCAAPIKFNASADPLAILGSGALAYARLSGQAARELAPALVPASELASLKPLLARTRLIALGLGSLPSPSETKETASQETDSQATAFQAVLIGDYPFRAASLSLGSSPGWKREKSGFYNAALGLRADVPGPSLLLASTGPIESLLAAAKAPGSSPIPEQLSAFASRELVLWAPEPFSGLGAAMLGEAMDVPARGLLIAASPLAREEGYYEATVVFVMGDADSVRIYKPALKLAWYGIAKALFGDEAEAALSLPFAADGNLFLASGLRLSGESLGAVLAALRSGQRR